MKFVNSFLRYFKKDWHWKTYL